METSIAGILHVFLVLYIFMRGKSVFENLVLLYAVSGLFLEIGIVLSIGSSELGPTKFLGYILGFYCVLHVKQVPQRIRKVWLGLIIDNLLYTPFVTFDFISKHSVCGSRRNHMGCNVWIGDKVTILGGVTIGDNVIIGAGSIITHDIPSNSMAAGAPAKVVKKI